MWCLLMFFIAFPMQYVAGASRLCDSMSSKSEERKTLSCTTQISGGDIIENDFCKMEVYPANSQACTSMSFGPLNTNTNIGGVTLRPHVITSVNNETVTPFAVNHTVLNITFSNIKWKSMRFRFQDKYKDQRNHCRQINIAHNAKLNDRSVLYYDCYWTKSDERGGQSHILDFEAYSDEDGEVNRGRYYFNMPTAQMLSPVAKAEEWKPFIYIEIFPGTMRLHTLPPPAPHRLRVAALRVDVMKQCTGGAGQGGGCQLKSKTLPLVNGTDDVTYDYDFVGENGLYYFVVTPMHRLCIEEDKCTRVESPKIIISSESQTMSICIASVTALIVATLFAYYVALRVIRRYWCRDYTRAAATDIPQPTKVLVVYPNANRLHAECVASFVTYLRTEYGFDVMYDGDISGTSHADPYIWAAEAFRLASNVLYVVGPLDDGHTNIYDKPITTAVHKDVDTLLLSFVKTNRVSRSPKEVVNVFFEHSNGQVPIETKHDKVFFLLKDWQKLISYLSKNLLPKRHIMRTERGRCFLEDLSRANKALSIKRDDVTIKCEKVADKKILL